MSSNSMDKEVNAIKKDLSKLRIDIGSLARTVEHRGLDQLGATKEAVVDHLASALDGVRERGKSAQETVKSGVQSRPLASLAVAFGVGILAGRLLLR